MTNNNKPRNEEDNPSFLYYLDQDNPPPLIRDFLKGIESSAEQKEPTPLEAFRALSPIDQFVYILELYNSNEENERKNALYFLNETIVKPQTLRELSNLVHNKDRTLQNIAATILLIINDPKFGLAKMLTEKQQRYAIYLLAHCYNYGIGITQNITEALKLFSLAAKKGYPEANYRRGIIYKNVLHDEKQAADAFLAAANSNVPSAQFEIGLMLLEGSVLKQNIPEAIAQLKLAARNNVAAACYQLGLIYTNPMYPEFVDTELAFTYFKKAADLGNVEAQYRTALHYYQNNQIKNAFIYASVAADRGNIDAMALSGVILLNGTLEVHKDLAEANKLLNSAAQQGSYKAQLELTRAKNTNVEAWQKQMAANKKQAKQKLELGLRYLKESDKRQKIFGLQLIQDAAYAEDPDALFHIGCTYLHGDNTVGVEQNEAKGLELLYLAAEKYENQPAIIRLYIYFLERDDQEKAKYWDQKITPSTSPTSAPTSPETVISPPPQSQSTSPFGKS